MRSLTRPFPRVPAEWPLLALALLGAVAGLMLRLGAWRSSLGHLDGDEAVWGLMAKHVLQGDFSTFYWGQSYGGTQEVFLTAPLVKLFGLNVAVIRTVPILLTAVAAVLVWRIGLRTVGPTAAVGAAVLFWIAPAYVIWKSTRAHGFYGSALVLTCLMLLLVLRLDERPTHRDAALLGLVLGLGWWQSAQTVTVAVPAIAWLILRRPAVLRETATIISMAVLGAIPWIHSNLNRDWWSLDGPGAGRVQDLHAYRVHLRVFLDVHLPVLLDLRAPFTLGWTLSFLPSLAIFAGFLFGFSWLAWTRRRESVSLLIFVVLVYPFVYALSEAVWIVDEPRYVVLLTPSIALLLAWPLQTPARATAGCAVAAALSTVVLVNMAHPDYQHRSDGAAQPTRFGPLIRYLDAHHADRVLADYWIAYPLDFLTNEKIIAAQSEMGVLVEQNGRLIPTSSGSRHWAYYRLASASRRTAIVYAANIENVHEPELRARLLRHHYSRKQIGAFVVYLPPADSDRLEQVP